MFKRLARPTMEVHNVGIYKPPRNLPNINQPNVLSVDNYLGSPFYSYMFVTSQKKREELRDKEVQEMLNDPENLEFYIQKMSYDLKLQKVSMGAILLKNTYVHMKNMRKFIWQHNNATKVIVKDRADYLPAFKKMLTEFILLNYCAFNTPGLSGAVWIPERRPGTAKSDFDFINRQYQAEFKNFEYRGQICELRHPNPLNGHPMVNFSAYTTDMSDGRVFIMKVAKCDLKDAINTLNAQIFELLSNYLGSLSIMPTDEDIAEHGIDVQFEEPSVFELIEEKPFTPVAIPSAKEQAAAVDKAFQAEQASRAEQKAERRARGQKTKLGGPLSGPPAEGRIKMLTKAEAAKAKALQEDVNEGEFKRQKEAIEQATPLIAGNRVIAKIDETRENLPAMAASVNTKLAASKVPPASIDEVIKSLGKALRVAKYTDDKGTSRAIAMAIIYNGLDSYPDLTKKARGLVAFTKKGAISKNSGYLKARGWQPIIAKIAKQGARKGDIDVDDVYKLI